LTGKTELTQRRKAAKKKVTPITHEAFLCYLRFLLLKMQSVEQEATEQTEGINWRGTDFPLRALRLCVRFFLSFSAWHAISGVNVFYGEFWHILIHDVEHAENAGAGDAGVVSVGRQREY
jgi:hypothetical protein